MLSIELSDIFIGALEIMYVMSVMSVMYVILQTSYIHCPKLR